MRVLIVGSMGGQVTSAVQVATTHGAIITQVQSVDGAMEVLKSCRGADVVFADLKCQVAQLIKNLQKAKINIPVIACSMEPIFSGINRSFKIGGESWGTLQDNSDKIISAILQAITQVEEKVVIQDPIMERWIHIAEKVAPSDASVLISGETGTGKEIMARYIHQQSKRSHKPFIVVNCAMVPETLLESVLFGHEIDSFRGGGTRQIGKFEKASGGTLLLDEITQMSPRLQGKLLQVLQEMVIDRVGSIQPIKIDVRLMVTTSVNMRQVIQSGQFREDLYYRLNVVNLCLPPLRERPKDVIALAKHFIKKYTMLNELPLKLLTERAVQALENYPWPGNVRELENALHRAVLLSSGEKIDIGDIFDEATDQPRDSKDVANMNHQCIIGKTIADAEKELILATLDHCYGNRTHAAHILGISPRTLHNKIKEYALGDSACQEVENA